MSAKPGVSCGSTDATVWESARDTDVRNGNRKRHANPTRASATAYSASEVQPAVVGLLARITGASSQTPVTRALPDELHQLRLFVMNAASIAGFDGSG